MSAIEYRCTRTTTGLLKAMTSVFFSTERMDNYSVPSPSFYRQVSKNAFHARKQRRYKVGLPSGREERGRRRQRSPCQWIFLLRGRRAGQTETAAEKRTAAAAAAAAAAAWGQTRASVFGCNLAERKRQHLRRSSSPHGQQREQI